MKKTKNIVNYRKAKLYFSINYEQDKTQFREYNFFMAKIYNYKEHSLVIKMYACFQNVVIYTLSMIKIKKTYDSIS